MWWSESLDRRGMLRATIGAVGAALLGGRGALRAAAVPRQHPEPRPGIDGSNVLSAETLAGWPELIPLYDGVRTIPHIVDGIRCACGCADLPEYRSLLSCFESSRMALHCEVCRGEGRMAVRLHGEGRTLDQIRAALDARYGR